MSGALAAQLPDGRTVSISTEVADRLSCGVVVLEDIKVQDNPAVAEATSDLGADLQTVFSGCLPSEIPGLREARDLYKSFSMDPSRHRPSSEALLRRVLKGNSLYRISNVVDTCNLASLTFLLPIGMYDLGKISGDVELRTGVESESYQGIRKGDVNLSGRLALFDQQGPFGSPTSDSARTCTSEETRTILAVIMATAGYAPLKMDKNLAVFCHRFAHFCGAREVFRGVLSGGNP